MQHKKWNLLHLYTTVQVTKQLENVNRIISTRGGNQVTVFNAIKLIPTLYLLYISIQITQLDRSNLIMTRIGYSRLEGVFNQNSSNILKTRYNTIIYCNVIWYRCQIQIRKLLNYKEGRFYLQLLLPISPCELERELTRTEKRPASKTALVLNQRHEAYQGWNNQPLVDFDHLRSLRGYRTSSKADHTKVTWCQHRETSDNVHGVHPRTKQLQIRSLGRYYCSKILVAQLRTTQLYVQVTTDQTD